MNIFFTSTYISGNKRNWRTPSRMYAEKNDSAVLAVDLRGHGHTALNDSFRNHTHFNSVDVCSQDIYNLFTHLYDSSIVTEDTEISLVAHSFGGKVALKYVEYILSKQSSGIYIPKHVWIVDSIPGAHNESLSARGNLREANIPPVHSNPVNVVNTLERVIMALHQCPEIFPDRNWIVKELTEKYHININIALWLATSLTEIPADGDKAQGKGKQSRFMFNIEQITQLYLNYCQLDMFPFLDRYTDTVRGIIDTSTKSNPKYSNIHILQAGKNKSWENSMMHGEDTSTKNSTYISRLSDLISSSSSTHPSISSSLVHHHRMDHVDHWVHSEDSKGFVELVSKHSI